MFFHPSIFHSLSLSLSHSTPPLSKSSSSLTIHFPPFPLYNTPQCPRPSLPILPRFNFIPPHLYPFIFSPFLFSSTPGFRQTTVYPSYTRIYPESSKLYKYIEDTNTMQFRLTTVKSYFNQLNTCTICSSASSLFPHGCHMK